MSEKIWVCDDEPSARFPVYTRGNVGEVFSDAVSPLTWSAYGPHAWDAGWRDAFCEIGLFTQDEFRPPGECEIVGCFGGYIYINMSVTRVLAVRIPGMTVEAIDKSLFGDYAGAPPYVPDPRDRNEQRSAQAVQWLQSLFGTDPNPATDDDRAHIEAVVARRPDLGALSDSALLDRFRALRQDERRAFKRHVLNTYGGNVLASVIAQISAAVGAGHVAATITGGVGEIESARQSLDLWTLSRLVRACRPLTRAFDQGTADLLPRLRADTSADARAFLAQWDAFIARWGFIGQSLWEFRSPTYRMAPEIPLRMLERARHGGDDQSPAARTADQERARCDAMELVAGHLRGQPEALAQFNAAAAGTGRYLAARERSKNNCALVLDEGRRALHELGTRLVQRGQVARWEHALLVTDAEADDFLATPARYAGMLGERATMLSILEAKEPPFVFAATAPPWSAFHDRHTDPASRAAEGTELHGIGVSAGRYTGRARVITSLHTDTELQPGEIIVALTTDSSWGPLFLSAGALVAETGATISHSAIVSRELGIPAAVSVRDAIARIGDGRLITVDGATGTVTLH